MSMRLNWQKVRNATNRAAKGTVNILDENDYREHDRAARWLKAVARNKKAKAAKRSGRGPADHGEATVNGRIS